MAAYSFIFISLIDPLHNGSGEGLGMIDRPIVRERTTNFPIIQPTSLKGVLRDDFTRNLASSADKEKVYGVFGPETSAPDKFSGAAAFGEGQILAFPIRSLKGCFVWATTRVILHRLQEKLSIAGITAPNIEKFNLFMEELRTNTSPKPIIPAGSEAKLLVGYTNPVSLNSANMMLEEFSYRVEASASLHEMAEELGALIFPDTPYLQTAFAEKLVLLPDDAFSYYVSHATEVLPNIAIGDDGTTTDGSLRYTEYLPRDSVMFSLVSHDTPRLCPQLTGFTTHADVKNFFDDNLPQRIQVGGDETTGKGLVSLARLNG